MFSKKAAINKVFTFLMIAILIGLIFLFGIRAITNLSRDTCEADTVLFVNNLNNYIGRYNTYGSRRTETLFMPCDYEAVCFVSANKINNDDFVTDNFMIQQSVQAGVERNIFLMKGDVADPMGFASTIEVDDGVLCISSIGNRFTVAFEGRGRTVLIKDPNE